MHEKYILQSKYLPKAITLKRLLKQRKRRCHYNSLIQVFSLCKWPTKFSCAQKITLSQIGSGARSFREASVYNRIPPLVLLRSGPTLLLPFHLLLLLLLQFGTLASSSKDLHTPIDWYNNSHLLLPLLHTSSPAWLPLASTPPSPPLSASSPRPTLPSLSPGVASANSTGSITSTPLCWSRGARLLSR